MEEVDVTTLLSLHCPSGTPDLNGSVIPADTCVLCMGGGGLYVCVCVCMCVCVYVSMCVCVYVCMRVICMLAVQV